MVNNKKALFFDVDGTIVDAHNQIPKSTADAIHETRKKGNLVFINSGRPRKMLKSITERVECDGLLCGCGTEIVYDGKSYFKHVVSDELRKKVVNAPKKYNIEIIAESSEGIRFSNTKSRFKTMNFFVERIKLNNAFIDDDIFGDFPLCKFCLQGDEESNIDGFIKDFKDDFDIIDRHNCFYECVPKGFSKGTAIKWVQNYFKIDDDNTYVFGDTTNDLPMFKLPVNSIAMGKHDKELSYYATFITDKLENDGIKKAMEHFNLI